MKPRNLHSRYRADGFTLIEVMVAIAVLSIGLLGVAKLSLGSMQANGSAFMRSQATELVQQIMDDMRANQSAAVALDYNIGLGVSPGSSGTNCNTGACSPAALAGYDLWRWYQMVGTLLPLGKGQVVVALTPDPYTGQLENTATVTVTWVDSVAQKSFENGTAPGTTMQVVMETLL